MPDIEGLKADPQFRALPPERQKAMLDHLSGGGSSGIGGAITGAGKSLEQGYEQRIAQPLTGALESGEEFVGIPPWAAKPIANTVVPQTLTGVGLDVASMALPELKAGRVLGDAARPAARFIGSRLGRMATMGGIGGATEAATGGSPASGVAQGALGEAGAQVLRGGAGMITRRLGKDAMLRDTTADFGKAMTKAMPWLGKIESTKDFADNFIRGGAYNKALTMLQHAKGAIARRTKGEMFTVPSITPNGVQMVPMPFDEADKMLTQLQRQSYLPVGDPRSGPNAADWGHVAHEARDLIAKRLDKIQAGMGIAYLQARRRLDAAITLGGHPDLQRGGVFRHPQIFDVEHGALDQPTAIERLNKFSPRLQRSLGKDNVDNMLSTLRRGATGERSDILPKSEEKARARIGVTPMGGVHATAHPGRTYQAIGKTPAYFEPPHAPVEIMTQNIISEMRAKQPEEHSLGPGMKALDTSRAEHMAPTPSASKRAEKVTTDLRRDKRPDVHHDLNRGRLSLDEVGKLLKHAADPSTASMIADLPLTEVLDAAEMASPQEREMLMPLIKQRLIAELPKEKNQTLVAKLSQRFQQLSQGVQSPAGAVANG